MKIRVKLHVKLRDVLKKRNITQRALAKETGLRANAISILCNDGQTTVNKEQIGKIAEALQITDIRELLELS